MEKKGGKRVVYLIFFSVIVGILLITLASAGFIEWVKEITGKATQTFGLNITVGAPSIFTVTNLGNVILNSATSSTTTTFNFSVYSPSGVGNLNHSTARLNITRTGETPRQNLSCNNLVASGDYANYSCQITMWWWDGNGTWNIAAQIEDNLTNSAQNTSQTQVFNPTVGLVISPALLTWSNIASGAVNQTSNNDPILINNTGNVVVSSANLEVNATSLRGESESNLGLWAGNFSVSWATGATNPECGGTTGTTMSQSTFTSITGANLTKGNFTINNGDDGQEELYFCLKLAGSELTTQAYSTANESTWTIQIPG